MSSSQVLLFSSCFQVVSPWCALASGGPWLACLPVGATRIGWNVDHAPTMTFRSNFQWTAHLSIGGSKGLTRYFINWFTVALDSSSTHSFSRSCSVSAEARDRRWVMHLLGLFVWIGMSTLSFGKQTKPTPIHPPATYKSVPVPPSGPSRHRYIYTHVPGSLSWCCVPLCLYARKCCPCRSPCPAFSCWVYPSSHTHTTHVMSVASTVTASLLGQIIQSSYAH